jgi:phosphoglycerate dehydrogenase-like enzyme
LIVGTGDIGQPWRSSSCPLASSCTASPAAREQAPFVEVAGSTDCRLVGEVDYVVNLLPNTPNTHDIYDAALFKQFKPTGLFINVGRGVAVVDADLVEALKKGIWPVR